MAGSTYDRAKRVVEAAGDETAAPEVRAAALEVRAIAGAVGVGVATIHEDLSPVRTRTPERTTGLDGKTYPARRDVLDRTPVYGLGVAPVMIAPVTVAVSACSPSMTWL